MKRESSFTEVTKALRELFGVVRSEFEGTTDWEGIDTRIRPILERAERQTIPPPDWSKADWEEVGYALDTKHHLLESKYYGPEDEPGQDAKWKKHLRRLFRDVEKSLGEKL